MKTVVGLFVFSLCLASMASAQEDSRKIQIGCGGSIVEISCGYSQDKQNQSHLCVDNKLSFSHENETMFISTPKRHDPGSTPIDLACLKGSDDNYYISVSYIAGALDCVKCKTSELYDPKGKWLSEHQPVAKIFAERKLKVKTNIALE